MKKKNLNILLGGFFLAVLTSCGNENIEKTAKEFSSELGIDSSPVETTIQASEIITGDYNYLILSKDKQDSSELTIDYAYYSIDDSGKTGVFFKDTINQVIADFVYAVSDMNEERTRPSFSISMFKESLPLFASFYEEMIQDEITAEMFPWQIQSKIAINDSFPDFVQLTTSSWSYTGGAHGNGFIVYTLVSKEDGHDMKMNDFFKDLGELNLLAAKLLKNDRELSVTEPLSNAGFWIEDESNFLNENFYFENGDLIVQFNPYEIASYADGPIEIRVSKSDLKPFLK